MANQIPLEDDYTYESSGLDEFFTRQQDRASPLQETGGGRAGSDLNFDDIQLGGALPDILPIGNKLRLNGVNGAVELLNDDGEITGVITGELDNYV